MKSHVQAEIPKNKYKKKTSIPILKTQIRGRERSEGEKDLDQRERDSGRDDPGRPKLRRPRHVSPKPRRPRDASLMPGSHVAWGDQACKPQAWGDPGARASGLGRTQWFEPPTPISDLDLLSLSVSGFFVFCFPRFFSDVLVLPSLICSYL